MADDTRRDLGAGIPLTDLRGGAIVSGRVGDEDVLVVERKGRHFAIGAKCTHYHGPLADGLVVGDTIRCPWHHACFSLESGEALKAPALDPVPCWRVETDGSRGYVREKLARKKSAKLTSHRARWPSSVAIVGGGAAGVAAAQMLRHEGYDRPIVMFSTESTLPVDRPNLSKDYLAGSAQADWMPLRDDAFYREQQIDLRLNAPIHEFDAGRRTIRASDAAAQEFGAVILATGAEPIRLTLPGGDLPHVHYLRSWADSDAIIKAAGSAKRAAIAGASFIGLEVAASLRARNIDVHVVAPERTPMERVLGPELGRWVQGTHESHGVVFHLGRQIAQIEPRRVALSDGTTIDAELVVIGVGVRPRVDLAERAGLTMDKGVQVNELLETSAPGVFAAGDIARWPDPRAGHIRVEHWVVAQRMGQTAARNILGARQPFRDVPFFWSQHYDTPINYVGHAASWDSARVDGRLQDGDAAVTYSKDGAPLALATIGRDRASLKFEAELEDGVRS